MVTAIIVDGRGRARTVDHLLMRCDEREMPAPADSSKQVGSWVTLCTFRGRAFSGGEQPTLGEAEDVSVVAPAALMIADHRLLGILSPQSLAEPAIWWSLPLAGLTVTTSGEHGLLKKRPSAIVVSTPEWEATFQQVGRVFRSGLKNGEEGSLVEALRSEASGE